MNRQWLKVCAGTALAGLAATLALGAGMASATAEPELYLTTRGWGLGACLWLPKRPPAALQLHLRNGKLPLKQHYRPVATHVPLMLGEIQVPNSIGSPSIEVTDRIRTTYLLKSKGALGEEALTRVTVNRLVPAILFELGDTAITLFAGDKTPGRVMRDDVYFKPEYMATESDFAGWAGGRWPIALGEPCGPRHYFFSDGESVRFGILTRGPSLASGVDAQDGYSVKLEGADNGWALLFYGSDGWFLTGESSMMITCHRRSLRAAAGDAPMLLLFSSTPALEMGTDGSVTVSFEEDGARMALLPLYGYKIPRAAETAEWVAAKALPEEVKKSCDWWAEHLAHYPLTVEESWRYDAASDTTVMSEIFSFTPIRDSGRPFAPMPPMLELARRAGFPLSVSAGISDSGMGTYCGPYAVVENAAYEVRVAGLGKYALEMPAAAKLDFGSNPAAKAVLDELVSEVDKILAAGHLAPVNIPFKDAWGWDSFHGTSLRHVYSAPGQTLATLAATLPFLDLQRQEAVKGYLQRERTEFAPEAVAHLPSDVGARREAWFLPEEFIKNETNMHRDKNFHVINKLVPAEALYDLACYYLAVGFEKMAEEEFDLEATFERTLLPWLRRADWPTLGCYSWEKDRRDHGCGSYGWNTIVDVNRQIASCIGLVRLARASGRLELENRGRIELARLLLHRCALAKYVAWLYGLGGILLQGEGFDPAEDERDVAMSEQTALLGYFLNEGDGTTTALPYWNPEESAYACMVPELGRFLAEHLSAEAKKYIAAASAYWPDAFMTWGEPRRLAEWFRNSPQDTHQIFMVHARVLGAEPDYLWRHLDVPIVPLGDLYHLDKLVAALQAYAGVAWKEFGK